MPVGWVVSLAVVGLDGAGGSHRGGAATATMRVGGVDSGQLECWPDSGPRYFFLLSPVHPSDSLDSIRQSDQRIAA